MYILKIAMQSGNVLIHPSRTEHFDQHSIILSRQQDYHYPTMSLAGVVGAMSLGGGVGDIMAISSLAVQVYTAYKDAPGDYRNISDEVRSLHIVINKAVQHFQDPNLSTKNQQEGQEVLAGCQNVLKDLDSLILKYKSLASPNTSQAL